MAGTGVQVATAALLRAWRKADYGDLWLQFTPRGDDDVASQVGDALEAANDAFDLSDPETPDVYAEGPWLAPLGPPLYQIVISRSGYEHDMIKWFETFGAHLEAAGVAGKLAPAPSRDHPSWSVVDDMPRPQLMSFVAYNVADPTLSKHRHTWNVDDDTTARIVAEVELGAFPGAESFLSGEGYQLRTEPAAAAAALRRTLPKDCIIHATHVRQVPPRVVATNFLCNGTTGWLVYDPQQSWQDRLLQLTATMSELAADTAVAFVQYSTGTSSAWNGLDVGTPPMLGPRPHYFDRNPHLLTRFVPDARGALVLTDSHLERANDLSGWSIESLGHGRHLVQARDLAAWFAHPEPEPDVLNQARTDFGDMILTFADLGIDPPRPAHPPL